MPESGSMKCVRRESLGKKFEVTSSTPVPDVPHGGARVKVNFLFRHIIFSKIKNSIKIKLKKKFEKLKH